MEVKGSKTRRARQREVRLLGVLCTRMLVPQTDCSHLIFVLGPSPPLSCPRGSTESAFPTTLSFSQRHDSGQGNKNGAVRERPVVVTFFCCLFSFWHATCSHFLETLTLLPSGELTSDHLFLNATLPVFFGCSNLFDDFLTTHHST